MRLQGFLECRDHRLDPLHRDRLKPLDLEQRGFKPQRERGVGAVLQRSGSGPARRPLGTAKDLRKAMRQRRRAGRKRGRHQRPAIERRRADEFGTGHQHNHPAREVIGNSRAGDARLTGINHEGRRIAELRHQRLKIGERGQDEAGLGTMHAMHNAVLAQRARGGDFLRHAGGDLGAAARHPVGASHRHVDQGDLPHARDILTGGDTACQRGLVREKATVGGMDAARSGLVRAQQHVVNARRAFTQGQRQCDIFKIGARGREDDFGIRANAIGTADTGAQRVEACVIDLPRSSPAPLQQMRKGVSRNVAHG